METNNEICPFYKTGRKCTNKENCCEKINDNCMSDRYYAMDLEFQLQLEKDNVAELNELYIFLKTDNKYLKNSLIEQKLEKIKKLKKIKETCKKCNLDKPNDVFDLKYKILEIIEGDEE